MRINGAKMSNEEIIEVVSAFINGCEIEVRTYNEGDGDYYWKDKSEPGWNFASYKYRPKQSPQVNKSEEKPLNFIQKIFQKPAEKQPDLILCLFEKRLISKEKTIQMLNLSNRIFDFNTYMVLFEEQLIDKIDLLSYIKKVYMDDRSYLRLYELSIITKEELLKAISIEC